MPLLRAILEELDYLCNLIRLEVTSVKNMCLRFSFNCFFPKSKNTVTKLRWPLFFHFLITTFHINEPIVFVCEQQDKMFQGLFRIGRIFCRKSSAECTTQQSTQFTCHFFIFHNKVWIVIEYEHDKNCTVVMNFSVNWNLYQDSNRLLQDESSYWGTELSRSIVIYTYVLKNIFIVS